MKIIFFSLFFLSISSNSTIISVKLESIGCGKDEIFPDDSQRWNCARLVKRKQMEDNVLTCNTNFHLPMRMSRCIATWTFPLLNPSKTPQSGKTGFCGKARRHFFLRFERKFFAFHTHTGTGVKLVQKKISSWKFFSTIFSL